MALDTYANLQDALNGWRSDTLFTTRIPDFITLFEAQANRVLRTSFQETTSSLTPSSGTASLPADYLLWRRLTWTGDPYNELEYVQPSYFQATYPTSISSGNSTNVPGIFTIEGSTIRIKPVDSANTALTLDYYAKIPALSVTNTTNWLLTSHPDIYLFGALCEAELFGMNDERAPMWKARRDEGIEQLQRLSTRSKGVGGARVMGPTP
jgi:hypothetical protein